jgi:hypothetical protein
VPEATACSLSVVADTIMRTIELGVRVTDAAVDEKVTTIFCSPVTRDPRCPDCGRDGRYRDAITRPLTDLPVALSPGSADRRPALPLPHLSAGGLYSIRIWASSPRRGDRYGPVPRRGLGRGQA